MLVRPFPQKQESLQSYIIKLSASNSWSDNAATSFFKANVAPLRSVKLIERKAIINYLVKETGHAEVAGLLDIWEMAGTYKQYLDLSTIKICPKCIIESDMLPPMWWFENYLVCVEHSELMVDSCGHCNKKLDRETYRLKRCCDCDCPITKWHSKSAIADKYSKIIGLTYSHFTGNTRQFIEIFIQQIMPTLAEIPGLHPLLVAEWDGTTQHRFEKRHSTVYSRYEQQSRSQKLADNANYLTDCIADYINDFHNEGEFNLGKVLLAFKPALQSESCQSFEKALYRLIFNDPERICKSRIGIRWLEGFLKLTPGELTQFSKVHCKSLLLGNQGVASISVMNVKRLASEYQSYSTEASVNSGFS